VNLKELGLGGNQLSGIIPESLGDLKNLTHLSLGQNKLTGAQAAATSLKKQLPGCSISV